MRLLLLLLLPILCFGQRYSAKYNGESDSWNIVDEKTGNKMLQRDAQNIINEGKYFLYVYGYPEGEGEHWGTDADEWGEPIETEDVGPTGYGVFTTKGKDLGLLYGNLWVSQYFEGLYVATLLQDADRPYVMLDKKGMPGKKKYAYLEFAGPYLIMQEGEYMGLLDADMNYVLPPNYTELKVLGGADDGWSEVEEQGVIIATDKDYRVGVLALEGLKTILPFIYSHIEWNWADGIAQVFGGDERQGLVDQKTGQQILPTEYDGIVKKGTTTYMVVKGRKGGLIRDGKEIVPIEYDNISNTYVDDVYLVEKDEKKGIYDATARKETVPPKYKSIYQFNESDFYTVYCEDGKSGIVNARTGELVLDCEYDQISTYHTPKGYVRVEKNGKWGFYTTEFEQLIPVVYDFLVLAPGTKDEIRYRKGEEIGTYYIHNRDFVPAPKMTELFTKKWSTFVGQTTFRNNILVDQGFIYMGSNGSSRNLDNDPDDALVILKSNGIVHGRIKPNSQGDSDVNGIAMSGNKLYFGTDNNWFYCYSVNGQKLWEHKAKGEIEGCPALTDLNGDKALDVVFAVENVGLTALDGIGGKVLWTLHNPSGARGFMGSPAVYDITGDGIADVIIGGQGKLDDYGEWENDDDCLWAVDGKTGKMLWTNTVYSKIHASPTILVEDGKPTIFFNECYGASHFLDSEGQLTQYFSMRIGTFSSPVFGPDLRTMFVGHSWWDNMEDGVSHLKFDANTFNEDSDGDHELKNLSQNPSTYGNRTTSTGFIADVLGTGSYQAGYITEGGEFILLDMEGKELHRFALPAGGEASITVADVDRNGYLDMLIADSKGNLSCYATRSRGKVWWGSFRGGQRNEGVVYKK